MEESEESLAKIPPNQRRNNLRGRQIALELTVMNCAGRKSRTSSSNRGALWYYTFGLILTESDWVILMGRPLTGLDWICPVLCAEEVINIYFPLSGKESVLHNMVVHILRVLINIPPLGIVGVWIPMYMGLAYG